MAEPTALALRLRELERCFQGVVPTAIATCSPEGIPNVTCLSIVHRVDDEHLALSFQFFRKTRANVLAHPAAQFLVFDPVTAVQYRMDAEYVRTEHEGPTFERLRVTLDAVASQTGMTGIFTLHGADIYRVRAVEELAHDLDLDDVVGAPDVVRSLETLSARLESCEDLDELLEVTLEGLETLFDHRQSMILFADGAGTRLYAVASRGFAASGVGAEVPMGHGLIGTAALERRPIRVTNFWKEVTMVEAVRAVAGDRAPATEVAREIPLPGLPNVGSQLAVPILARDRTIGVISVQSANPGRLTHVDESALATLARYLAAAIQLAGARSAPDALSGRSYARPPAGESPVRVRHHASDDSVFLDDEYLIKGVSGRILVRLLGICERDGRVDFTNRELRLDESLRLGGFRDNLEARLILLRRRLEERTPAIRIVKTGRGRFRLELTRPFELARVP